MLDTAVMMMQQYNTAATLSMPMGATAAGMQAESTPSDANATIPGTTASASTSSEAEPSTSSNVTTSEPSSKSEPNVVPSESSPETTQSSIPMSPEEEIRRRRLQRFQQPADE